MKINSQHQALLTEAESLKSQALAILTSEKSDALDIEKAERLMTEAEGKIAIADRISAIHQKAEGMQREPIATQHPTYQRDSDNQEEKFAIGKWLLKVRNASRGGSTKGLTYFNSDETLESKDLNEGTGSAGGYLAPTEMSPMLMREVIQQAIVRPRAMVIPMSSKTLEVPALKQDGTTAGQPHEFGGMVVFWDSEAATIQETEPAFRTLMLTAHKLTAVTHTSDELLEDSALALEAILMGPRGFPGAVAWYEDYAFLRGNGVGQPLGILNAGATIGQARTTDDVITYTDLINMMAKSMPSSNSVWIASQSVQATLMGINGPSGNASYLWGSLKDGVPATLLGRPIIFTEKTPVLGASGDIMLADFSHYYIGDRKTITVDATTQARWLRSQTSWRVVCRVDGKPWLNAPFTLADGITQISPFVSLNTYV